MKSTRRRSKIPILKETQCQTNSRKHFIEGLLVLLLAVPAVAQEPAPHHHPNPVSSSGTPENHHDHEAHSRQSDDGQAPNLASSYLLSLSSGTSLTPTAWSMPMLMNRLGDWNLMWMGQALIVSTQQTGPRGGDKVYSANWGMLAATRNLGRGSLMLRGMVSLDPITVSGKRYPLLSRPERLPMASLWLTGSIHTTS